MKYIISLLIIAAGVVLIIKTDWFMKSFGRNAWAEQKLGPGGSWTFYKLIGVAFILCALFIMSGIMTSILDFIFVH